MTRRPEVATTGICFPTGRSPTPLGIRDQQPIAASSAAHRPRQLRLRLACQIESRTLKVLPDITICSGDRTKSHIAEFQQTTADQLVLLYVLSAAQTSGLSTDQTSVVLDWHTHQLRSSASSGAPACKWLQKTVHRRRGGIPRSKTTQTPYMTLIGATTVMASWAVRRSRGQSTCASRC